MDKLPIFYDFTLYQKLMTWMLYAYLHITREEKIKLPVASLFFAVNNVSLSQSEER